MTDRRHAAHDHAAHDHPVVDRSVGSTPRAGDDIPERNSAYPDTDYPARGSVVRTEIAAGLLFVVGLWLVVAPWTLGYTDAGSILYDEVAAAGTVAALALVRLALPLHGEVLAWGTFVVGGWLVVSPFVFGYPVDFDATSVYWNLVGGGALVLLLAGWSAVETERALHR